MQAASSITALGRSRSLVSSDADIAGQEIRKQAEQAVSKTVKAMGELEEGTGVAGEGLEKLGSAPQVQQLKADFEKARQ